MVQFKRFTQVRLGREIRQEKNRAECQFFEEVQIESQEGLSFYEPIATIEHVGQNLQHGHYVTYIKKDTIWIKCDDTRVTSIGFNVSTPISNAYLILLKKK